MSSHLPPPSPSRIFLRNAEAEAAATGRREMALSRDVSHHHVQRGDGRHPHLQHRHHLPALHRGDDDEHRGPEAVHDDAGAEKHYGDAGGRDMFVVLVRGVVPLQGRQPL